MSNKKAVVKKVVVKKVAVKKAVTKPVKKAVAPKPKVKRTYPNGQHPGSVAGVSVKAGDIISLGGVIARQTKTKLLVDGLQLPATASSVLEQLRTAGVTSTSIALRWYILRDYVERKAA